VLVLEHEAAAISSLSASASATMDWVSAAPPLQNAGSCAHVCPFQIWPSAHWF